MPVLILSAFDLLIFGRPTILCQAMSGKDPHWKKRNDAARAFATCRSKVPVPEEHTGLPETDSLWGLLRECWSSKPEDRPTIGIVLQRVSILSALSIPKT